MPTVVQLSQNQNRFRALQPHVQNDSVLRRAVASQIPLGWVCHWSIFGTVLNGLGAPSTLPLICRTRRRERGRDTDGLVQKRTRARIYCDNVRCQRYVGKCVWVTFARLRSEGSNKRGKECISSQFSPVQSPRWRMDLFLIGGRNQLAAAVGLDSHLRCLSYYITCEGVAKVSAFRC